MSSGDDIASWLREQPLGEPVEIDGETVYLMLGEGGAELGAYLKRSYTGEMLQDALRQGFSSAVQFDAGVGQSADGKDLVLSQWLPHVQNWVDASDALEKLLNQLASWRAVMASTAPKQRPKDSDRKQEQRLRSMLMGARQ